MGTRLTSTLIVANLAALSGFAGVHLAGAIDTMGVGKATARAMAPRVAYQSVLAGEPALPPHPVRIVSREERPAEVGETMDQAAERLAAIETAAGPVELAWDAAALRAADLLLAVSGPAQSDEAPSLALAYRASEPGQPIAADSHPAVAPIVEPEPRGAAPQPGPETAALPHRVGHVVIGSFRRLELAREHSDLYKHLEPSIVPVELEGRDYYRVVVGPFETAALNRALKRILAAGVKDAWPLIARADPGASG